MKSLIVPAFTLFCCSVLPAIAVPGIRQPSCPVLFEGRVPSDTPLSQFDTSSSLYMPEVVKGDNLTWSEILSRPAVVDSRFDGKDNHPIEVTICDDSIFTAGDNVQEGFRRAGLIFQADNNTNSSNSAVETLHWSVRQDPERPLNLTHEYMNVWHELADFSANQFSFLAGQLLDGGSAADKNTFKILGKENNLIWSTPIHPSRWQNFAVTMDHNNNTLTIYYSLDWASLEKVTPAVLNDNSGGGQYQIGILKKPTGTEDVVNSGFQESGIDEGQIYGGVFVEDGVGCVSL